MNEYYSKNGRVKVCIVNALEIADTIDKFIDGFDLISSFALEGERFVLIFKKR